jgi:hypothetical protein
MKFLVFEFLALTDLECAGRTTANNIADLALARPV